MNVPSTQAKAIRNINTTASFTEVNKFHRRLSLAGAPAFFTTLAITTISQQPCEESGGAAHNGTYSISPPYFPSEVVSMNSTLLFFLLPSSVALSATGRFGP